MTTTCGRLTGALEPVADAARPADVVDERAVHVAPEVVRAVKAVLVHQPQPASDHLLHQGHPRPAQVVLVHHLHAHQLLKGELQVFVHLAEQEGEIIIFFLITTIECLNALSQCIRWK